VEGGGGVIPGERDLPLVFIGALLIALVMFGWPSSAGASSWSDGPSGVTIRVEGEGWGSAERDEIETVLQAVAAELIGDAAALPQPIVVTHAPGSPVTLFERGPAGEYQVRLSARDRRWAQYAYQFGHELCHVMSNFQALPSATERARNQWFEEALCEAAGLFALRTMAARWQATPPYPSWDEYAPALRAYADRLIAEPHRHLPDGVTLERWLHGRLEQLGRDPYLRNDNEVVANMLLTRFEQNPAQWAALHYLNLDAADAVADLPHYLRHWRDNAPHEHRPFIDGLVGELGLAGAMRGELATSVSTAAEPGPTLPRPARAGVAGPPLQD